MPVNRTFHPRYRLLSDPELLREFGMLNASAQCIGLRHSVAGGYGEARRGQKKGPEDRGRKSGRKLRRSRRGEGPWPHRLLEAEAGKIAVAERNAGPRHQRAIDGTDQAGEEGRIGREADSSCLGHCSHFP